MMSLRGPSKVDVLIYCHDGRGLGHLSRSIAIALAIRRLRPATRVVLLTGSEYVPALAGYGSVEWIKLPSYAAGPSLPRLVDIRRKMIQHIISDLKPSMTLVDHYPAGKHDELLPVLEDNCGVAPLWFLGLRAVVGRNPIIWSEESQSLVRDKYSHLFWYGDSSVASDGTCEQIKEFFSEARISEVGYVSRAAELASINALPSVDAADGVAAFSWLSPASVEVLGSFAKSVETLEAAVRRWRVAVGNPLDGPLEGSSIRRLAKTASCKITSPDLGFLSCLQDARVALLYAGYNSLTDLIWAGVPSIVVVRDAKDGEQAIHARALSPRLGGMALFIEEQEAAKPSVLRDAIAAQLERQRAPSRILELRGAERTAGAMLSYLRDSEPSHA